jgi:restriction system protein
MAQKTGYWIFSNNSDGSYGESEWDTNTILKTKHYYFKDTERNRPNVQKGDFVIFRTYGLGYWGTCQITSDWIDDPAGESKWKHKAGWFEISDVKKWKATLPYELIKSELSNQNHRLRIAKATLEDKSRIELALKIYQNMGYGATDGNFFVLENGLEEAVKKNLGQLNLSLADKNIQQQCTLGIGVGRTDLICRNKEDNYVVLELKAINSSDGVVGQILRYMGYIRENWAEKENKKVKGIIITPGYDEQLRLAAKEAGIKVLRIKIG